MSQEKNLNDKAAGNDMDVREMQDEARKTLGYADDPHIESSNRPPDYTAEEDAKEEKGNSGGDS